MSTQYKIKYNVVKTVTKVLIYQNKERIVYIKIILACKYEANNYGRC